MPRRKKDASQPAVETGQITIRPPATLQYLLEQLAILQSTDGKTVRMNDAAIAAIQFYVDACLTDEHQQALLQLRERQQVTLAQVSKSMGKPSPRRRKEAA